jgi:hypothetical protein
MFIKEHLLHLKEGHSLKSLNHQVSKKGKAELSATQPLNTTAVPCNHRCAQMKEYGNTAAGILVVLRSAALVCCVIPTVGQLAWYRMHAQAEPETVTPLIIIQPNACAGRCFELSGGLLCPFQCS